MAASLSFYVASAGCGGGYMSDAKHAYSQGRYLEAAEELGEHEHEVERLSPRRQAEYGMFRGLSLLMLDDFGGAMQWMSFAYDVDRQHPGSLRPEQRAELDRGFLHVTRALGTAPPSRVILAPPPPPPPPGGPPPPGAPPPRVIVVPPPPPP